MRICLNFTNILCNEWFMLHSTDPVTANEVKSGILWNNIFSTIDTKSPRHGEWYGNGILYENHFLDKNVTF